MPQLQQWLGWVQALLPAPAKDLLADHHPILSSLDMLGGRYICPIASASRPGP